MWDPWVEDWDHTDTTLLRLGPGAPLSPVDTLLCPLLPLYRPWGRHLGRSPQPPDSGRLLSDGTFFSSLLDRGCLRSHGPSLPDRGRGTVSVGPGFGGVETGRRQEDSGEAPRPRSWGRKGPTLRRVRRGRGSTPVPGRLPVTTIHAARIGRGVPGKAGAGRSGRGERGEGRPRRARRAGPEPRGASGGSSSSSASRRPAG